MTAEKQLQNLVEAFKPPLEEALIVAIAGDYDIETKSGYDDARTTLQSLAQDALAEEAAGFNPSGISGDTENHGGVARDEDANSSSADTKSVSQQASQSQKTESSNTDPLSQATDVGYAIPKLTSFSEDSEESKLEQLRSLFPEIKEYDITHTLKKANGDFQAALDELLNVQELQSSGLRPKGIDGFFQPDETPGPRKKGKKSRRGKTSPLLECNTSQHDSVSHDHAHMAKRQEEISYIADRFLIPYNDVAGAYSNKKHSAGATVAEILEGYISKGIEPENEESKERARELAQKYRNIPEHYLPILVHLTDIPQFSDDLAALLSKHFAKNPWTQRLDLNYSLKPLSRDDIEGSSDSGGGTGIGQKSTVAQRLRLPPISTNSPISPMSPLSPASPADLSRVWQLRDHHNLARREASASATQLAKSSSPLMRQGAGFYAERAREHGRSAQQATSEAADLQVLQNSTRDTIDLHGVYVQDGVRIARQRTLDWYQGLGEYKVKRAKAEPFTVITGIGRHSAGGVSQMRRAVAAALLQDGWKMQIEGGKFVITGRR